MVFFPVNQGKTRGFHGFHKIWISLLPSVPNLVSQSKNFFAANPDFDVPDGSAAPGAPPYLSFSTVFRNRGLT